MRYSCLHGWSFISSWWIFLFRTLTLERPPPPIGTQPPVESSRIITWARTRTTELPLKWIKLKENRMKNYNKLNGLWTLIFNLNSYSTKCSLILGKLYSEIDILSFCWKLVHSFISITSSASVFEMPKWHIIWLWWME